MEFEIADDPQGVPDRPEGNRAGDPREDGVVSPRDISFKRSDKHANARHEYSPIRQFGEVTQADAMSGYGN